MRRKGCGVDYRERTSTEQLCLMKTTRPTFPLLGLCVAGFLFSGAARADVFATAVGGGVGALAGAVIGDSVAGRNGAIIGSGIGGAVGAVVGQSLGQPAAGGGYYAVVPPGYGQAHYPSREVYYSPSRADHHRGRGQGWGHDRHHHHGRHDRDRHWH